MEALFCTKCKSKNIEVYTDMLKVKSIPPKSIDKWFLESLITVTNTVTEYHKEIAKCKDCDYKVERWRT